MNTSELTAMLAAAVEPTPPAAVARRMFVALAIGGLCALCIMLWRLGLRSDIASAAATPMFWVKLGFPAGLGLLALFTLMALARPGAQAGRAAAVLPLPVLAIWALAAVTLVAAPPAQRHAMVLGATWMVCPFIIAGLALPALAALLWALKGLAPTRLSRAGAVAGLLAGTVGAAVYALHCPEAGAAFLGIWYLLGMVAPAAAGALMGRRMLRW